MKSLLKEFWSEKDPSRLVSLATELRDDSSATELSSESLRTLVQLAKGQAIRLPLSSAPKPEGIFGSLRRRLTQSGELVAEIQESNLLVKHYKVLQFLIQFALLDASTHSELCECLKTLYRKALPTVDTAKSLIRGIVECSPDSHEATLALLKLPEGQGISARHNSELLANILAIDPRYFHAISVSMKHREFMVSMGALTFEIYSLSEGEIEHLAGHIPNCSAEDGLKLLKILDDAPMPTLLKSYKMCLGSGKREWTEHIILKLQKHQTEYPSLLEPLSALLQEAEESLPPKQEPPQPKLQELVGRHRAAVGHPVHELPSGFSAPSGAWEITIPKTLTSRDRFTCIVEGSQFQLIFNGFIVYGVFEGKIEILECPEWKSTILDFFGAGENEELFFFVPYTGPPTWSTSIGGYRRVVRQEKPGETPRLLAGLVEEDDIPKFFDLNVCDHGYCWSEVVTKNTKYDSLNFQDIRVTYILNSDQAFSVPFEKIPPMKTVCGRKVLSAYKDTLKMVHHQDGAYLIEPSLKLALPVRSGRPLARVSAAQEKHAFVCEVWPEGRVELCVWD